MHSFFQDLRFGVRMLRKNVAITVAAVLTLAIGVGANTAAFSLVYHLLLNPLSYDQPDRLARIAGVDRETGDDTGLSLPDVDDIGRAQGVFESVAALRSQQFLVEDSSTVVQVQGAEVTPELFSVLRIVPALGRPITDEDCTKLRPDVVVLSHGYWVRQFGGARDVLGRSVTIDRRPVTVVGILPESVQYPFQQSELWMPLSRDGYYAERKGRFLTAIARLAPDASLARAREALATVSLHLQADDPKTNGRFSLAAAPLLDEATAKVGTRVLLLQGAVAFVLLIACANVANLLLARAATRGREVAIRSALGAGRLRIVRQFLIESVLLSLLGGTFGLAVAVWLLNLLFSSGPAKLARLGDVHLNGWILGFTLVVSTAVGLIFGIVPAVRATRTDVVDTLKRGGSATLAAFGRDRFRNALLVTEIALSLMLLIGAGLIAKAFWRLENVTPGFTPEHALAVDLVAPEAVYADNARVEAYYQSVVERVRAVPGVESAGAVDIMPLVGWNPGARFQVESPSGLVEHKADYQPVTPEYFRAIGIPCEAGRSFTDAEFSSHSAVAVVNRRFAAKIWPDGEAVGQRIRVDTGDGSGRWLTVIGVVGDVRQFGVQEDPRPELYVADVRRTMTLVARTSQTPESAAASVIAAIRDVDPNLPLPVARTLASVVDDSLAVKRFGAVVFSVLAVVALLLAMVGIYGVISYSVSRRTQEIGIRMALGARGADVARMILKQCLRLTAIGVAVGLCGSFAVTRLLRGFLYGVSALDPQTFFLASCVLIGVAVVATLAPIRTAIGLSPLVALRYE